MHSNAEETGYILCRPQGGLNDMLGEIEKCCQYADRTNRIVIVDTNYEGAETFQDDLSQYFESNNANLCLSLKGFEDSLSQLSVFPNFLLGRINSYRAVRKLHTNFLVDQITQEYISFDFNRNYSEKLLVHHSSGGATNSHLLFQRLRLKKNLKLEIQKRLNRIGGAYLAVHIRNTDYFSDCSKIIKLINCSPYKKVFISTDNQESLNDLKTILVNKSVFSFANVLSVDGKPIHLKKDLSREEIFLRNLDSILDLLLLALSEKLLLVLISGRKGHGSHPVFSGYFILAWNLRSKGDILEKFLAGIEIQVNKPSCIEKWLFVIKRYYLGASRRLMALKFKVNGNRP